MNKAEVYDYLNKMGIAYEVVEHAAVFTVEEADALHLPHPEAGAKNLFLRDDKKRNYYLLTVRDHLPVRLDEVRKRIGSRRLSFASEEDLGQILGLIKGSVTPLGILNDEAHQVHMYFDSYYKGRLISVHPNENTATIFLQCDDLLNLIKAHGNEAEYLEMEEA